MKRLGYILLFSQLLGNMLHGQWTYPSDICLIDRNNLGMTVGHVNQLLINSANDFQFVLGGSNTDNFKTLPHIYSIAGIGRYKNGQQNGQMWAKYTDVYRAYPSIQLAGPYVPFGKQLVVEIVTGSAFMGLAILNPYTGLRRRIPEPPSLNSMVALSKTVQVIDGEIFLLAARCDGIHPFGYSDYNIIDDDTLFLMKVDWSSSDFAAEDTFYIEGMTNTHFMNWRGDFNWDPNSGLLKFLSGSNYFELESGRMRPTRGLSLEEWQVTSLNQLDGTWNFTYGRPIVKQNSDEYYSLGTYIKRWRFKDYQIEYDSIPYYWPRPYHYQKYETTHYFRILKMDSTQVYGIEESTFWEDSFPIRFGTLIKTDWQGHLIWEQELFGEYYQGTVDYLAEVNDTLIVCGNLELGHPVKRFFGPPQPFIRRLSAKDGHFIDASKEIKEAEVLCYPNPFQVDFYLEFQNLNSYELYNERGELIKQEKVPPADYLHHFHWPYLKQGLYFLILKSANGKSKSVKLVKRPW